MTSETPAADPAVIERYRGELARVDELTGAGDYEAAIALLQNVARSSGDEALMQRLIELRVVAMPLLADKVDPQPMYEANELLGRTGRSARTTRQGRLPVLQRYYSHRAVAFTTGRYH